MDSVAEIRAMPYATLMVYVDVGGKMDGRVSVAADLARRFDAHLIGIASGAPISVVLARMPRRRRRRRNCATSRLCSAKKRSSFVLRSGRAAGAWNGDPSWGFRPM